MVKLGPTPHTPLDFRVCFTYPLAIAPVSHAVCKDVVSIEKSGEHFRLLYDVKGRFTIHRITPEEATYKLLKVKRMAVGARGVPYIVTHDGRTIRYPDPLIRANDTVRFDLEQNKITDFVKFDTGNICMITGGRNMGRAGVIVHRERHVGGFDIVHVKDSLDRTFATRFVFCPLFRILPSHTGFTVESPTFSSLVRVRSHGSLCPRARAPNSPFPKKGISEGGSGRQNSRSEAVCDFRFIWYMYASHAPCMLVLCAKNECMRTTHASSSMFRSIRVLELFPWILELGIVHVVNGNNCFECCAGNVV